MLTFRPGELVGAAWDELRVNEKIPEVFLQMGFTLPVDGSEDDKLKIRALPDLEYPVSAPEIPKKLSKAERNSIRAVKGLAMKEAAESNRELTAKDLEQIGNEAEEKAIQAIHAKNAEAAKLVAEAAEVVSSDLPASESTSPSRGAANTSFPVGGASSSSILPTPPVICISDDEEYSDDTDDETCDGAGSDYSAQDSDDEEDGEFDNDHGEDDSAQDQVEDRRGALEVPMVAAIDEQEGPAQQGEQNQSEVSIAANETRAQQLHTAAVSAAAAAASAAATAALAAAAALNVSGSAPGATITIATTAPTESPKHRAGLALSNLMGELMDAPQARQKSSSLVAQPAQDSGQHSTAAQGSAAPPSRKGSAKTPAQLQVLTSAYDHSTELTRERRERLAAATGLTARQVTDWFTNRKRKERAIASRAQSGEAAPTSSAVPSDPSDPPPSDAPEE